MSIQGIGKQAAIQKIVANSIQKSIPTPPPTTARGTDKVELSDLSRHLEFAKSLPDIRAGKVADIKAQIAAGKYPDDDQKLDIAIDRLLDDLA